ncbi:MAG: two-component regulator propeller domain-containing protein, partial [Cyclobacteriaceae bacterium]
MNSLLPHIRSFIRSGLWLLFLTVPLTGQSKSLNFTDINGLPRNIVNCIEQDKYGYLWIGTANGIARYDGQDFNTYSELSTYG